VPLAHKISPLPRLVEHKNLFESENVNFSGFERFSISDKTKFESETIKELRHRPIVRISRHVKASSRSSSPSTLKAEGWLKRKFLFCNFLASRLCDRVADLTKFHCPRAHMLHRLISRFSSFSAKRGSALLAFLYTFNFIPLRASDIARFVLPSHRVAVVTLLSEVPSSRELCDCIEEKKSKAETTKEEK
jgi:hypothetical protein